ncbi:phage protein Gp27 family protein, partial [Shinella sp.]
MRPRPSAIDQLPEECEAIVAWAAQELANTPKSQTEIYAEFRMKLIALQGELGLAFDIPHFSSFNRHALRLAKVTQRLQRSQMIADA